VRIIISPAKKMNRDTDSMAVRGLPAFMDETRLLTREIQKLSLKEARALWQCNEKLAELNYERFQNMDLEKALTPAVLAYEGLQYQHMAPAIFTDAAFAYIEEHLRILSGFYGVLKPLDGVTPYRLEMKAQLPVDGKKNLVDFWGDKLYREVIHGDRTILNLASKEYADTIEKYLKPGDHFITVYFGELSDGSVRQKGTFAKMARGEMARFMAERNITEPEEIRDFCELGLRYSEALSDDSRYIFLKDPETAKEA